MIQRDYFERLTQQVAKVLARLIGKDWEKIILTVEELYDKHLPFSRSAVVHCSTDDFPAFIQEYDLDENQLEALAYLLKIEGEHLADKVAAEDRLSKALYLYQIADENSTVYSLERLSYIQQLEDELA